MFETAPKTEVIKNPFCAGTETDLSVPTATLQIYDFIDKFYDDKKDTDVNRCSAAPKCVRQRWYKANGYKPEPIAPRARVNFLLGDLSERALVYYVTHGCVGPGKLYSEVIFGEPDGHITYQGKDLIKYKQMTTSFRIGALTITGHYDGLGKRNSDGQWELLEFKSSSNYGFSTFKDIGPEDYLNQAHALMMTDAVKEKNVKSVRFFYLKKDTGHLWDGLFHWDQEIADKVVREYQEAAAEKIPEKPFGLRVLKNGKTTVETWHCSYCPFTAECHGKYTIEFEKGKPKYYFENKADKKIAEILNKFGE